MDSPSEMMGPVNLVNPHGLRVRDLADLIVTMTRSKSRIVNRPLPSDDPLQRCPDISRAEKLLGWSPRVQMREVLCRTIAHFEEALVVPAL